MAQTEVSRRQPTPQFPGFPGFSVTTPHSGLQVGEVGKGGAVGSRRGLWGAVGNLWVEEVASLVRGLGREVQGVGTAQFLRSR